ncbi:unnamed protein product [Paramecium pentaurelia]|uniref:WDR19 first beta-propeller domain-containing protein n=1 Tax=Paramecium pentaurelia TaxID=43138 RepID=A0A8S1SNU4_9CILI|nr:unnamed protein product [Paramecium pentaurelia]
MQGSFQVKEAIADIFDKAKDVDIQIFGVLLEIFGKEKVQDCIQYLSDIGNQRQQESQILQQVGNFTQTDTEQILSNFRNDMKQIRDVLRKLKDHDFNYKDFSSEENEESKLNLIKSIKDNKRMIEFLQFLVHLTSIDNTLIQCGSNSLHILIKMKVDLRNQNFEKITIQNTSLLGANLVRCNFSESQFKNVNISGTNLNGALLFNCKWRDLRICEVQKLHGYCDCVKTVCFSPDGNTLASGSADKSIRLWDVKTGQQKAKLQIHRGSVWSVGFSPNGNTLASVDGNGTVILWDIKTRKKRAKLDGHRGTVYSVCFSPDGNTLASGSDDYSIRLWDVKTGQQKAKLDGHTREIMSVCFSPDGNTLASGSGDNSIRLCDVKTGQQKAKLDSHTNNVNSNGIEIQSDDNKYKDIPTQFKIPLFQNKLLPESNNITIQRISQTPLFQAQGALILKGEFVNYKGYNLRYLLKSKGYCFLEDYKKM